MIDFPYLKRAETSLLQAAEILSRPRHLQRVQHAMLLLLIFWALNSVAQLFWVLWPTPVVSSGKGNIINPALSLATSTSVSAPIEVEGALGLGLFGDPTADLDPEVLSPSSNNGELRAGIEEGAKETRLALRLTGIVALTDDGLGSAVIAVKKTEASYAVGDELPVDGQVTLAKVMPTQVVLDNGGTYELLTLFDDSTLDRLASQAQRNAVPQRPAVSPSSPATLASEPRKRVSPLSETQASQIAAGLRAQLYEDPQSLAQLVNVAAVKDDGGLKGYRVSPGKNPEAFRQLGFKAGDVITAVNGLSLSDPSNTVRLYQMMRDAKDATFEIERGSSVTSLSVSLP